MERRAHKLSVLGDRGSGRSSVVAVLTGKPCPNHPGIQVSPWLEPGSGLDFDVWDVNSRSALEALGQVFIGGCEGLVAVADASSPASIRLALQSLRAAIEVVGARPALLLLNKSDLPAAVATIDEPPADTRVFAVSARSGTGVREAFAALAKRLQSGPATSPVPD